VSPGPVRVGANTLVPEHGHTKRGDGGALNAQLVRELVRRPVVSKSAAYSLSAEDDVCLVSASGGAVTITLPAASIGSGAVYSVKKTDASANVVTVDGAGAETIDGAATYALTVQYQSVTVVSTGSAWAIV
jgi:hypothetical protein